MTVMTNRFYAPKGRHIVIKLTVLSVLGVLSVHIICGVYLLYYFRQECRNSCLKGDSNPNDKDVLSERTL